MPPYQDRRAGRGRIDGLAGAALVAIALGTGAASAQDDDDIEVIEIEETGVQLSFGVAIVSDYIDDGESLSSGNPALQGYVEASYGMLFGGVWASTVDFEDGDDNVEFDFYVGVRHEFGDVELALSYIRYVYDQTGDCCGEFALEGEYEFNDAFAGEVELSWDPEEDATWAELALAYSFADKWSVLGSIGTDFGTESEAEVEEDETAEDGEEEGEDDSDDTVVWEFGVAREITDYSSVALTYYHSNNEDDGVVLALAFDF